ncbi:hypothetical protein CEXT_513641 [Caerostris extrusa]|uniref:Uncharacterized protein n=1 Tax=Caerostris extrusa TaxID=172846 RepID=A0AAV4VA90_CAEEX|nr:hypothetical protein CEXT_513641 [Caerostris extrusa]
MEVDDEGCCASFGKSPPKGSTKVPVPPVPCFPVDNPSSDLDHDSDDGPYNYQGSAPLPKTPGSGERFSSRKSEI